MNNIIKRTWKQNGMVQIEDLRGQTFQNESGGHTFVIRGEDEDGNQIALSGSPAGVFLRPDNTDQALTCSISNGMVYATLPAACYDVPGRAGITIYLTSGGQKTALYAAMVSVGRTSTGTVAPGTTADVVDLINRINEVVATIPPDYSALSNSLKPITIQGNLIDPSILITTGDTKLVNNNNGTYTAKPGDYGNAIVGSQITLEPGYYYLFGVPEGFSFLSTNQSDSGKFFTNDQPTEKLILVPFAKTCYVGFRVNSSPSAAYSVAPYIRKALEYDNASLIADVENAAKSDEEEIYLLREITAYQTVSGYRLDANTGLSVSDANYQLKKYTVTAGDKLYIKTDDVFQFQNDTGVPSTGTSNRVGKTYRNGGLVYTIPTGVTILIVSTAVSGGSFVVKQANGIKNAIGGSLLLEFERGSISSGSEIQSNAYVRTGYYFATKNSTITIAPVDFKVSNMVLYFYTEPDEEHYISSANISDTAAGGSVTYTFTQDTYFRLRASKEGAPNLTDAEALKFNDWYTFYTFVGCIELLKEVRKDEKAIKATEIKLDEVCSNTQQDYLLQFERGAIFGGTESKSNGYVRTKYYYASKGSTITIEPTSFDLYNMVIYYYTSPTEEEYTSSANIANTPVGYTRVFTIAEGTYFRIRASKYGAEALTDEEVLAFNNWFTLKTIPTNLEIAPMGIKGINRYNKFFYYPDSWSDKAEEIHKVIGNKFAFGIQTDTHLSLYEHLGYNAMRKNDVIPFKVFTNYVGMDFIANLGDIIRGYQFDEYEEMQETFTEIISRYIENVACPVLFAVGNHDDAGMWTVNESYGGSGTMDEVIKPSEQYAILMKPSKNTFHEIKNPPKELYYFVDFDQVRVIVLNTRDLPYQTLGASDVEINHHEISAAQLSWLENTALDTTKPVIVMCHVPLLQELAEETNFDGATEAYNILKAFKTGGGNIVGVFCGHTHQQDSATVDGILNVVFKNGADFAEIVIVDIENNIVETKMVGNYGALQDRRWPEEET